MKKILITLLLSLFITFGIPILAVWLFEPDENMNTTEPKPTDLEQVQKKTEHTLGQIFFSLM